ncbi:MAG TPA: TrmH family RNA methyltransferase [Polyangia bacterium]|jgi:TrmH family RNA methyltransferase
MPLVVVLVRTHSPGNLGAVARAAKNFRAELALLDPRCDRAHPDALAFASGAEELLAGAAVVPDWAALEVQADRVVALTSLRGRAARGLPPALTWPALRREAARGRVALVFGPERGGLTTAELGRCEARLSVPTAAAFPTLNLAQAVAAALVLARTPARAVPARPAAAPAREVTRLLERWHELLRGAGYPARGHSSVMAEIDAFLRRGRPTAREVTILLGALAALDRRR